MMKLPLAILCACLASCQTASETVTTTTSPDGVTTQTVRRPVVDAWDAAMAEAAQGLMQGGFAP